MPESRIEVAEALAYFRADPHQNGPVILTPAKMRTHLAVIEAALRDAGTGRDSEEAMREAAAKCADAWRMNGAAVAPLFGMTLNETVIASKAADGIAAAIRALPLQTGSDGHA